MCGPQSTAFCVVSTSWPILSSPTQSYARAAVPVARRLGMIATVFQQHAAVAAHNEESFHATIPWERVEGIVGQLVKKPRQAYRKKKRSMVRKLVAGPKCNCVLLTCQSSTAPLGHCNLILCFSNNSVLYGDPSGRQKKKKMNIIISVFCVADQSICHCLK